MRRFFFKFTAVLVFSLALGLIQLETPGRATTSNAYKELRRLRAQPTTGLQVYVRPDPDFKAGRQPEIVDEALELNGASRYVESGLAVFNGPVRVSGGGVFIGREVQDARPSPWDAFYIGPVNRGWAVFNGPVTINSGSLTARSAGQAVFYEAVDIAGGGIYLRDTGYDRAALTFQGPVSVKDGDLDLQGENSAIFLSEVKVESGGLRMAADGGRASVTLGGRGRLSADSLEVTGGNRLIFSLSESMAAEGFIQADRAAIDADCLVIDNPDDVLKVGAEIILITGGHIELGGGRRKIVTRQGDEFELLVHDNRISARLTSLANPHIWYNNLQFDF